MPEIEYLKIMEESSSSTTILETSSPPLIVANIASLIFIKLDSNYFLMWSFFFLLILMGHKLIGVINGSTPAPLKTILEGDKKIVLPLISGMKKIKWCYLGLMLTLLETTIPYTICVKSIKEAWNVFEICFGTIIQSHIIHLKQ